MSREALGEPGLGVAFVAALERGAVRPSRPALGALAERLGIEVEQLTCCKTRTGKQDLRAHERDLAYQLDLANWMLHGNRIEDALACIDGAERHARRYLRYMSPRSAYRIPYLRGKAHSMARRPEDAQRELEAALRLLGRFAGSSGTKIGAHEEENVTALIQTHNLLGVAHYIQGHLTEALKHHLRCRRLLAEYSVANAGVRLGIYRNLANDYWAGGDFPLAISTYKEALALFEDLHDPQRKAGVHWGLSMCYRALGDLVFAAVHARQAVGLYIEAGAWGLAASMRGNLAEVLIDSGRYREAEDNLNVQSRWLQEPVPLRIWQEQQERQEENDRQKNGDGMQEEGEAGIEPSASDEETEGAAARGVLEERSEHEGAYRAGGAGASSPVRPGPHPEKADAGLVHVDREDVILCGLYENYARLAWKKGDFERAAVFIERSVEAGEHAVTATALTGKAGGYSARHLAGALDLAARIQESSGNSEACDLLFRRALLVVSTTEFAEAFRSIATNYAEVLEAREDYKGATKMYRLAASKAGRQAVEDAGR